MTSWKKLLLNQSQTVLDVAKSLDSEIEKIIFIVDENEKLVGSVTDGDIRRGILRGVLMNSSVTEIMNSSPVTIPYEKKDDKILTEKLFIEHEVFHIPIVSGDNKLTSIAFKENVKSEKKENFVVLMCGGLGSRLGDLTKDCPKPLLKVGKKPILETIIEKFKEHGFYKIFLSINYKGDLIKEYFGNGSKWDVEINYLEENEKLGTAGSLSLLVEHGANMPFIVMNGDILTKINLENLLEMHNSDKGTATMCVRQFDFKVPYGVVTVDDHKVSSIVEKPVHNFFVNAGVYVLDPICLKFVKAGAFLDMPTLLDNMMKENLKVLAFPIREYWLDIGQVDDFNRANFDYDRYFE